MKIIKLISLVFAISLLSIGCINNSRANLKKGIEEANRKLPTRFRTDKIFEKIQYNDEDNQVIFTYTIINPEIMETLSETEVITENLRLIMLSKDFKPLLNELINAKSSLKFTYKSAEKSETVDFVFTSDQLKEISKMRISEDERAENLLKNAIQIQNSKLPIEIEEGLVLTKLVDEGENVVIYFEIDLPDLDMNGFQEMLYEDSQGFTNVRNDPDLKQFTSLLKPLNKGLVWKFVNKSTQESAEVRYTSIEL